MTEIHSENRPFSRGLYRAYNDKARKATQELVASICPGWHYVRGADEQYSDWDVCFVGPGSAFFTFEVEVKRIWKQSYWPPRWLTIRVPGRKRNSKANYHLLFNADMTTVACTRMSNVLDSPIRRMNTTQMELEEFLEVPLRAYRFFSKRETGWIEIDAKGRPHESPRPGL